MEGYSVESVARNVIVHFKAFRIAGGCNKIEICTVCFQAFVASVRLHVRIGIGALVSVMSKERSIVEFMKCQILLWSVGHIVHPLATDER
jgi:hypothetical protein